MPVASVDPMASRMRRTFPAVGAALLALALVTGCAPEPAPTPTPTGFASDDEAFAAAEATVRDYFDASNVVDLSDPRTFDAVFALTTADQNAFDRKRYSEYSAEGYVLSGTSNVISTRPSSWDPAQEIAVVETCLDVSSLDLKKSDGTSLVSSDRPDKQSLEITLKASSRQFRISSIAGSDQPSCGA